MYYYAKIIGVKETEQGTDLLIHIPDFQLKRQIQKYSRNCEIKLNDNRLISVEQRKKIYATIQDICNYTGDVPEYIKEYLKYDFCQQTGHEYFSLSDCSLQTARLFINHIIEFVIRENIPLSQPAIERTDDIDKYLYYCLKYRKCAITGRPNADIHHCEGSRVGMGMDRRKISNKGRFLIALSREWHQRVHVEGEEKIFKAYKIYGIRVDDELLKELKLSPKDIS